MAKRTTLVDLGNGQVAKRTSEARYTYAAVAEYSEADKARDVAAVEKDLVGAVLWRDAAVAKMTPAVVAEYEALVAVRAAVWAAEGRVLAAADAAYRALQMATDADYERQKAAPGYVCRLYSLPDTAPEVVAEKEARRASNALYATTADGRTARRSAEYAVGDHAGADAATATARVAALTEALARAKARKAGPETRDV